MSDRDIVERLDWSARMTRSFAIRYLANDAAAEIRRLREQVRGAREALGYVAQMPCLTALLGEDPEEQGCGCASCIARTALAQLDAPTPQP